MRNFKRALALVLAFVMIVGTFATVSATGKAASVWYDEAVDDLDSMGISDIGNTAAQTLTRNEFVFWIAKIESGSLEDSVWKDEIASVTFQDVNENHHKAAIAYAYLAEFIIGDGEGNFLPDKEVTLGEIATVLVRMMRWTHRVTGLDEAWGLNNMRVANTYINAFTPEFLREVGNYDPNYTPTKGEVAYILCTIMNRLSVEQDEKDGKAALSLDRDGNNLGARFEGIGGAMVREETYFVYGPMYATDAEGDFFINEVLEEMPIMLVNVDYTNYIYFTDTVEFRKAVRVSLGMTAEPDHTREEKEIDIFDYVSTGTLVNIKLNADVEFENGYYIVDDYTDVKSMNVETGSIVVNTYLQINQLAGKDFADLYSDYLGLYVNSVLNSSYKTNDFTPVLPSSYSADNAATWSNIDKRTGWVEVEPGVWEEREFYISATLTFKGVSYVYNLNPEDIVYYATRTNIGTEEAPEYKYTNKVTIPATLDVEAIFSKLLEGEITYDEYIVLLFEEIYKASDFVVFDGEIDEMGVMFPLTVEEAVNTLINAAQGESYTVFNDVDGDGIYDNAVILGSDPFDYENTTGTVNNSLNIPALSDEATEAQLGTVKINKDDSKIQLTLAAGGTGISGTGIDAFIKDKFGADSELKSYTTVDLVALQTGVIEEVQIRANDDTHFYKATIRTTDGVKTVWIPTLTAVEDSTTELNVTLGGATATYTFDNSDWFPFLDEAWDVVTGGILGGDNTDIGANEAAATAAWMMSKYVQFAINADNEVIAIYGTDEVAEKAFVVGVNAIGKDETDAAKYEVILAVLGATADLDETVIATSKTNAFSIDEIEAFFSEADVKKIQTVVKDGDVAVEFTSASNNTYYKSSFGTTEVVENENGTYSKVTASFWGNNKDLTAATSFVVVREIYECDKEGTVAEGTDPTVEASKNEKNEWVDAAGNTFALTENRTADYHVADITKLNVRANASAAWDYDERVLYEALFTEDAVMDDDNDAEEDGSWIVDAYTDLIYVTLMQDGGSNYLLAGFEAEPSNEVVEGVTSAFTFMGVNYKTNVASTAYPASDDINNDNWFNATGTKNDWDAAKGEDGVSYLLSKKESANAARIPFNVAGFQLVENNKDKTFTLYKDADGKPVNVKNPGAAYSATSETHNSVVPAGYKTTFEVRIGNDPQYRRSTATGGYKYGIEFATVEIYDGLPGIVDFSLKASKAYMSPVYENIDDGVSKALQIAKKEDQEAWKASRASYDTNVYYFDASGYAFYLLPGSTIEFNTVKDADKVYVVLDKYVIKSITYDYESDNLSLVGTIYNVKFDDTQEELAKLGILKDTTKAYQPVEKDEDGKKNDDYNPYIALKPYGNFVAKDADSKTAGYFPGLYTVTINGVDYKASEDTEVVIITPSLSGFDITSTVKVNATDAEGNKVVKIQTLKDIKNEEYFVTEWDFDGASTLKTIVIVGEKVGVAEEDTDTEETPVVNTDKLVYLPAGAEAYISLGEYADDIRVYSDRSAYLLPSGEEFGAIYRTYPTYKEALNDLQINLAIQDDTFYVVTADREIVKASNVKTQSYEITSITSAGVVTLKTPKSSDEEKGDAVSLSGVTVKYFYNDANGELKVVTDTNKLTVLTEAEYLAKMGDVDNGDAKDGTLVAALKKAQTEYDDAKVRNSNGSLAAENFQVYADNLQAAKDAIAAYEAEIIEKNFNGQLWGSANSAVNTYYTRAQTSQDSRKLRFSGIMVEENGAKTLIVFTDSLTTATALK